jgi:hypothetical protein
LDVTLPYSATIDLDPAGDNDCFRFTTTAAALLSLAAADRFDDQGVGAACVGDPLVRLFAEDGDEIDSDDDDGVGVCPLLARVVEPGTYVACYQHYSSFSPAVILGLTVQITASDVTTLDSGDICDPTALDAVCDRAADLECLLSAVMPATYRCATRTTLVAGDTCVAGVQTAVCDRSADLSCVDLDGDGTATCVEATAAACEAPTAITSASFSGRIPTRPNLIRDTCDFEGKGEAVLSYTVQNPVANVAFSLPFGTGFTLSVREECTDALTEVDCRSGSAAVTASSVAQGTVFTVIVEGPADAQFTLNVAEQPHDLLGDGETCELRSTTESCDPRIDGLACVGAPGGPFACGVPTVLASGAACVVGATDALCDASQSLACERGATGTEGVCATITSTAVTGELTSADPTWDRPGSTCSEDFSDDAVAFDSFLIVNQDNQAHRITIIESAVDDLESCAADLFLHVYSGAVVAATPLSGCIEGSDDEGPLNCGQLVDVELPARGSIVAVVSTYSSTPTLPVAYQLNVVGFGNFTVSPQ